MGSKTRDTSRDKEAAVRGRVRVAYSLNNGQPVTCSLIGDQPLFFMDYEENLEDDAGADPFGIENIEEGILSLESKIAALDKLAAADHGVPEKRVEEFLADGRDICSPLGVALPDDTAFERAALIKTLQQSRFAAALFEHVRHYGTDIHIDGQSGPAFYNRNTGQIYISPGLDPADQVLLAVRELRRAWQHRNGALLHPLTFHPDQAILVNRAQAADLAVNMVRAAWELQLAGNKQPWERVEYGAMADLARAFAREAFLDFRTLNNGVASSAVFESWFLSDRCREQDRQLIQQMLSDYQGYVFEGNAAAQKVTAAFIAALGSLPFGKNYLAPYVSTIINDALFTEVRDRSNANFLWFIKFERSFRETEQGLQEDPSVTGSGDRRGPSSERNGKDEKTADIVDIPGIKPAGRGQGNIVAFRRGTGEAG